jgi:hypothetical protein
MCSPWLSTSQRFQHVAVAGKLALRYPQMKRL